MVLCGEDTEEKEWTQGGQIEYSWNPESQQWFRPAVGKLQSIDQS